MGMFVTYIYLRISHRVKQGVKTVSVGVQGL